MHIYTLLRRDGALLDLLLARLERCAPEDLVARRGLLLAVLRSLRRHEEAEERSIFPLLIGDERTREDALRAREDSRDAEALAEELRLLEPEAGAFEHKVAQLSELVRGHFRREQERLIPAASRFVDEVEAERLGLQVEGARRRG